jgi:hypothetical protein
MQKQAHQVAARWSSPRLSSVRNSVGSPTMTRNDMAFHKRSGGQSKALTTRGLELLLPRHDELSRVGLHSCGSHCLHGVRLIQHKSRHTRSPSTATSCWACLWQRWCSTRCSTCYATSENLTKRVCEKMFAAMLYNEMT